MARASSQLCLSIRAPPDSLRQYLAKGALVNKLVCTTLSIISIASSIAGYLSILSLTTDTRKGLIDNFYDMTDPE